MVLQGETLARMKLEERLKFYKTPAVSVAVINGGKIEWAKGYGFLKASGQQAVTKETKFQAASISKTLTAIAALRLVEQNKLALDEDVNIKLRSWMVPESDSIKVERPTLRRVLSHNAGFTVPGFIGYPSGQPLPTLLQILNGQPPANSAPIRIDRTPGTGFRYAGGGYEVLQQLLMDASGSSFSELMQPILKAARMSHSTFAMQPSTATNVASGHWANGNEIDGGWYSYPELAAAGLWTTPTDLAELLLEIQRSANGKSNRLLSSQSAKLMLTPQVDNWGFGLIIDGDENIRRFSFAGANVGYKAMMVCYLRSGQGAVVMTNSENGAPLGQEILRSIAAEYGWPDYKPKVRVIATVDTAVYSDYVGEYELAPGAIIVITKEGDKLISQGPQQPKAEMLPESKTTFFLREVDATFTFVKDDTGRVIQVNIRRGGREFQAKRIRKE